MLTDTYTRQNLFKESRFVFRIPEEAFEPAEEGSELKMSSVPNSLIKELEKLGYQLKVDELKKYFVLLRDGEVSEADLKISSFISQYDQNKNLSFLSYLEILVVPESEKNNILEYLEKKIESKKASGDKKRVELLLRALRIVGGRKIVEATKKLTGRELAAYQDTFDPNESIRETLERIARIREKVKKEERAEFLHMLGVKNEAELAQRNKKQEAALKRMLETPISDNSKKTPDAEKPKVKISAEKLQTLLNKHSDIIIKEKDGSFSVNDPEYQHAKPNFVISDERIMVCKNYFSIPPMGLEELELYLSKIKKQQSTK